MKLVIKGAYYYDKDSDTILVPHYTGEFSVVDCDEFILMPELEERYGESYINDVKDYPIEFEGMDYFSAEYSPFYIGDWELVSDLSEVSHLEENFDF